MNKSNLNPAFLEELDVHKEAIIELEKIKRNQMEQSKMPLRINRTTVIYVTEAKATDEYKKEYINRMAYYRELYFKD